VAVTVIPCLFLLLTPRLPAYPILVVRLKIRSICTVAMLFNLLMLANTIVLHIYYVFAKAGFHPEFYLLRIASLGAFIAFRLKVFSFFAFKRDNPTKSYCNENRGDVPDYPGAGREQEPLVPEERGEP
jgi:hypothetical protein